MATVQAGGFNQDPAGTEMNSVQKLVRERLSAVSPDLRDRLGGFCRKLDTEQDPAQRQSKYLSYALVLEGPPKFAPSYKVSELPAGIQRMAGFETLVEEIWREAELARLWDEVKPLYLREIEEYQPRIREMIISTLAYMRTEARVSLDREMTFIPDQLGVSGLVNARNIGPNYIIMVGPVRSGERPMRSVRHEYLHFLIDPLLTKYVAYLPEEAPFLKRANEQPAALERYKNNFRLMVTESLLQMLELRLENTPEKAESAAMIEAYSQGLILAPYFREALHKFERGSESFPGIFQALVEGIHWASESGRDTAIASLRTETAELNAREKSAAEALSLAKVELRSLLNAANQHMAAKEFDRARELLEKVMQLDPVNASAIFGLAQISGQEQSLDSALELYERAASYAHGETWIAAWSYVHRGNIYRALEEPEKAKTEWSRALKLVGDLRGAEEAARKALAQLSPPKQ
jgi:tetratricopeptide (TPR) repeat protein